MVDGRQDRQSRGRRERQYIRERRCYLVLEQRRRRGHDDARRPALQRLLGPAIGRREHLRPEARSEEPTSELQSLMRISYAVFCLKKKTYTTTKIDTSHDRIPDTNPQIVHSTLLATSTIL